MRIEKDLIGEREVPPEAYYGIHTLRAAENFKLTGRSIHPELCGPWCRSKRPAP